MLLCALFFSFDNDNYSFCWTAFNDLSPPCINGFLKLLNPKSLICCFCVAIVAFQFSILLFEIPLHYDVSMLCSARKCRLKLPCIGGVGPRFAPGIQLNTFNPRLTHTQPFKYTETACICVYCFCVVNFSEALMQMPFTNQQFIDVQ